MKIIRWIFLLSVAGLAGAAEPRSPETAFVDALPAYVPQVQVDGTLRLWGHGSYKRNFMSKLLTRWTTRFHELQPGVTFENRMYGTASAIGALSLGAGDLSGGQRAMPRLSSKSRPAAST